MIKILNRNNINVMIPKVQIIRFIAFLSCFLVAFQEAIITINEIKAKIILLNQNMMKGSLNSWFSLGISSNIVVFVKIIGIISSISYKHRTLIIRINIFKKHLFRFSYFHRAATTSDYFSCFGIIKEPKTLSLLIRFF